VPESRPASRTPPPSLFCTINVFGGVAPRCLPGKRVKRFDEVTGTPPGKKRLFAQQDKPDGSFTVSEKMKKLSSSLQQNRRKKTRENSCNRNRRRLRGWFFSGIDDGTAFGKNGFRIREHSMAAAEKKT